MYYKICFSYDDEDDLKIKTNRIENFFEEKEVIRYLSPHDLEDDEGVFYFLSSNPHILEDDEDIEEFELREVERREYFAVHNSDPDIINYLDGQWTSSRSEEIPTSRKRLPDTTLDRSKSETKRYKPIDYKKLSDLFQRGVRVSEGESSGNIMGDDDSKEGSDVDMDEDVVDGTSSPSSSVDGASGSGVASSHNQNIGGSSSDR